MYKRQVYTVSVRDNDHCEELFDALSRYAVEGPHYFDDDAYTDMPEKELVAEVIREKALLYMRDEIPPVSYTHLDVYKRQGQGRPRRI